jgi:precorrin-3B synthase
MALKAKDYVRGWCPGALRPMESGDGFVARVRAHAGTFPLGGLAALCDGAQRYGNGVIDLTHRANLQIRGVRPELLPDLLVVLGGLGLLDDCAEAEAVRNILVSPLAGVDPAEILDVRPLAADLETELAADPSLWGLPGKFGFLIDGGGLFALDQTRADIRLLALAGGAVAIGLDRHGGPVWIGRVNPGDAASVAVGVARAYLSVLPQGARTRMRDLSEDAFGELLGAFGPLDPLTVVPSSARATGLALGSVRGVAVGAAAAFGSIEAKRLQTLAECALALGAREARLSPWRAVFIPIPNGIAAKALALEADRLGFIINAADPLLRVDACPGAPACRSAALPTRDVARRLAGLAQQLSGVVSMHVSGCVKGCMHPSPADLTLTAVDERFAVIRAGMADGAAEFTISPEEIDSLPACFTPNARAADV